MIPLYIHQHLIIKSCIYQIFPLTPISPVSLSKEEDELKNLESALKLPNQKIEMEESGSTFLVLKKIERRLCLDEIKGQLEFEVVILDEDTEEEVNRYQDEFQLEELELKYSDYISRANAISFREFQKIFKAQGENFESSVFQFENKTIENVISDLKESFNLRSIQPDKETASDNFKTIYLYGEYAPDTKVMMVCQVGFDKEKNCIVSLNGVSTNDSNQLMQEMVFE